jgi:hypothetical protein
MFPSARENPSLAAPRTLLTFIGSSVANGAMMRASTVAMMPKLAERSKICPDEDFGADKYQHEREEGLERCSP